MRRHLFTLLCSALALSACRGNDTTTDSGGGGDTPGGAVKIQDVQNDMMAPGTAVSLHGVVVTAVDAFGAKTGDIWVEEPEGGEYSGIHVFMAPVVAGLAQGDIVDITGAVKDEFALSTDTTGRTVTELKPATGGAISIMKTGTGTVPAPAMVNALTIGMLPDTNNNGQRSAEWEKWEGVLITVTDVSALGAPQQVPSSNNPDPTLANFDITGVATVESSLSAFPTSGITRGACLGTVTGVVDYFFDYLILPRTTGEVATGGSGCPALETACADSADNDGNGFMDCGDNNCIITDQTCSTSTTINALDTAADANPATPTLPTGGVKITAACVTAVSGNNIYIAANGGAAADGGLYVFNGGGTLPSGVAKNSTVDVIGTAKAFKASMSTAPEALLELSGLSITKNNPNCSAMPTTVTSPMATLTMDANGHPLIGSLVTLTPNDNNHNFKITTAQSGTGKFGVLTENATTISFGMTILGGNLGAANTCFGSITGIWTYDTFGSGAYEILPTVMPTTATCQ